jgi:Tol biopolymer transport system component
MADTSVESAWRVAITGGNAERLGPSHVLRPVVSPDGRSIAHYWMNPDRWTLAVTPIGSELPTRTLPLSRTHGARVARWSPDGRALALVDSPEGAANIWLQPLDGSPARKLTDLAAGTIETFDWSRDGSWLAWMQVRRTGDVVAVE